GRVAACIAQQRRIKESGVPETVSAEYQGSSVRHIIDLHVVVVTIERGRVRAKIVENILAEVRGRHPLAVKKARRGGSAKHDFRRGLDSAGWNCVVWKRCTARGCGGADIWSVSV